MFLSSNLDFGEGGIASLPAARSGSLAGGSSCPGVDVSFILTGFPELRCPRKVSTGRPRSRYYQNVRRSPFSAVGASFGELSLPVGSIDRCPPPPPCQHRLPPMPSPFSRSGPFYRIPHIPFHRHSGHPDHPNHPLSRYAPSRPPGSPLSHHPVRIATSSTPHSSPPGHLRRHLDGR